MTDDEYVFYALTANGHTASIYNTSKEALDKLSIRVSENDQDSYGIEPIEGIWRMMERMADLGDRFDDDWMEEALQIACQMVFRKRELIDARKSKNKNPPEKTNSKD